MARRLVRPVPTRARCLLASALAAAMLMMAPPPRAQEPTWWAVVVGIDEYASKDLGRLRGAVADARAIKAALERNVGIPPAHIKLLVSGGDINPTKRNILESLADLQQQGKASENDRLFFFFAGHGAELGRTRYLLTHDTNASSVSDIESSGLPASQLMQKIEEIKLRDRVVLIDACREDPSPLLRQGPYQTVPVLETAYMTQPTSDGVRAVYWSASRGEFAWEWDEIGRGFFSYYAELALRGAAGYRGYVTVNSLKFDLSDKVPPRVWQERQKHQTPYSAGEGELVLVPANRMETTPAEAALLEPRTISGVVTDPTGATLPATTVRVEIVNAQPEPIVPFGPFVAPDDARQRTRTATTLTDGRGFYKFYDVAPDALYRVEAERAGHERATNLSREAGTETPLVLPRIVSAAARAQELARVAERQFLFEDFRAAETTANQALAIDRAQALATAVLGNAIATIAVNRRGLSADERRSRLAEARGLIDRALAMAPTLALAHNGRGLLEYANQGWNRAQQHFARAVQLDPTLYVAHANLGETRLKQRRFDDARRAFERAIAGRPQSAIPYNGLANAYIGLRNWTAAVEHARQAIARHPREDEDLGLFYLTLALGLHEQKKCAEVREAMARARALGADDARVTKRVANCK